VVLAGITEGHVRALDGFTEIVRETTPAVSASPT